jgi:hypothetical protein
VKGCNEQFTLFGCHFVLAPDRSFLLYIFVDLNLDDKIFCSFTPKVAYIFGVQLWVHDVRLSRLRNSKICVMINLNLMIYVDHYLTDFLFLYVFYLQQFL